MLAWNEPRLTQYPASQAITWLTSFEQLGEAARSLLRRLAWLSPAPIPENRLEVAIAGEAPNPGGAFDALVELEGLSLLNRSGESPQFVVHRLVQELTRLRQELAQEPHELAAALDWIDAAFVGEAQDIRSWPVLVPLEPHAKAVANFAAGAGVTGATARLMSQVGVLLLTKADLCEAEPLMRRALRIEEANYGKDHPDVAIDLNNLAVLLQATNRPAEAEPLMRHSLHIDEENYGKDHPRVAIDLNNLAGLLQATDRLVDAETMMRRSLQIDEASYGRSSCGGKKSNQPGRSAAGYESSGRSRAADAPQFKDSDRIEATGLSTSQSGSRNQQLHQLPPGSRLLRRSYPSQNRLPLPTRLSSIFTQRGCANAARSWEPLAWQGQIAALALPYGKPDRIGSGLLQSLPWRSGLNLAPASNQFCRTSR